MENDKLKKRTEKIAKSIEYNHFNREETILLFELNQNYYAIETKYLESIKKNQTFRKEPFLEAPFLGFIYYQGQVYNVISLDHKIKEKNTIDVIILKELYIAIKYDFILNSIVKNKIILKSVEKPEFNYLKQYFSWDDKTFYVIDIELLKKSLEI